MFGTVLRDVDADFRHDFNGERMNIAGGFRTCALDVENVASGGAQKTFGEMTPAGIPGAENENGGFH